MPVWLVRFWTRRTLAQQFMLVSFAILVTSMIGVGWWTGEQIKRGVINRTAATTALYVDSFVAPQLRDVAHGGTLEPEQLAAPNRLLQESPLGQQIVSFKIWGPRGQIIYASNPAYTGRDYPVSAHLAHALRGEVHSEISDLRDAENEYERGRWDRLLETYIPIHQADTDQVSAVAEFYQTVDDLEGEIADATRRNWLVVGVTTLAMYLLLSGIVQRGSNTIVRQQRDLRDKVERLTALLAENDNLHQRVHRAATRTTTLNERYRRRLSAELHDGPAQELSLALLRLDSIMAYCAVCSRQGDGGISHQAADLDRIQSSLTQALKEIRVISSGLRLPELDELTLAEAAMRVINLHERRTETKVARSFGDLPAQVPLPVKITLYRVIQEALNNAYRHADGVGQEVEIGGTPRELRIVIRDRGPGFDGVAVPDSDEHLGLIGMRERVESIGGVFRVDSVPGHGTSVIALLPLESVEGNDERTDSNGHRGRSPAPQRRRRAHPSDGAGH